MEDISHRKISDTDSIDHSTLEEFCRTRRKLRKISQVQIVLGIGLTLVGILVCAGTGLLLLISVPSRKDVRILIDRVETLESTLSGLRKDINENSFSYSMMGDNPVSMGSFMPSDLMKNALTPKSKKTSARTTRPRVENPNTSFSRYLIGRLNQTVSGLDEGNKLIYKKLNRSLVRLKYDFDVREDQMDRKLKENSKQLLKLSDIVSQLVSKLERGELEKQVDTMVDIVTALSKSISVQPVPHPHLLEKISNTANESMVYFGSILSDELIIIQNNIQEAIIGYVEETKHHYINIDESLGTIVANDLRIEESTKTIQSDLENISNGIDPLGSKVDQIISEQNRFDDNVEKLSSMTEEIEMDMKEVLEVKSKLFDATKNASNLLQGLNSMHMPFVEKLEDASDMLQKLLKEDSLPLDKKLQHVKTMMKDELKEALETLESSMNDKSVEFSSLVKQEIKKILNEQFEKDKQMMEIAMQDQSASGSTSDIEQIFKEIYSRFEKAVKMVETMLNDQSSLSSMASGSSNNALVSKVCTRSEGCTSIEYPSKRCFKVIEAAVDEATWVQAKRKCQLLGGHLAEIHNAHEYDILVKSLPTYGNYWVGGTDRGFEGYWHWDHSLLRVTLNNWAPGQPNNKNDMEHCLHLLHSEITVWNDLRCMAKMGYVCEKEGPKCEVWT